MRVRITQLDGAIPSLALMRLAGWHRSRGDEVTWTRQPWRGLFEPDYDRVYGGAIFEFSAARVARLRASWPNAVIGGTWSGHVRNGTWVEDGPTVEQVTGMPETFPPDYSDQAGYTASIGFTQRGCRLRCAWCVVPGKEGKARSVSGLRGIWRGEGHPRNLVVLDNDTFGVPETEWRRWIDEAVEGGYRINLTQGINIRHLSPTAARALASIEYRDTTFRERKLYTAWDMLKDERLFFRGIDMLEHAGIPPSHVRAYMLVGWTRSETMTELRHRFDAMVARGIEPFPMVYDCRSEDANKYRELKRFQRWAITGLYRATPFEEYDTSRAPRNRALARKAGLVQDSLDLTCSPPERRGGRRGASEAADA